MLRLTIMVTCLLLAACAPRTVVKPRTVEVPRYIRVPAPMEFTKPCQVIEPPPACTWRGKPAWCNGQIGRMLIDYRDVLGACNVQLDAIRGLQHD